MSSNVALGKTGGKSYENTGTDGATTFSGFERTSFNLDTGNTTDVSMHTQHDEKGNAESHTVNVTTRNKDDEVISSTSITNNSDGTRTETTTSADGSRVQKTFDKDGKLVSTTEYPATDDEAKDAPEEGNGKFWDVDIIYGDHPDMVQSSDMVADLKMAMEMDPALEMYVDHFDFIM